MTSGRWGTDGTEMWDEVEGSLLSERAEELRRGAVLIGAES
jgi:hypothetical protein